MLARTHAHLEDWRHEPVRRVENKRPRSRRDPQGALLHQKFNPARRADDDVAARAGQSLAVLLDRNAADERAHGETRDALAEACNDFL